MFDIGAIELLVVVCAAILIIGPKDMPMALRSLGRWIAKVRKVSGHFRAGIDTMIREAEMDDLEKQWKERNDRIMAQSGDGTAKSARASEGLGDDMDGPPAGLSDAEPPQREASAEARANAAQKGAPDQAPASQEPDSQGSASQGSAAEAREGGSEPKLPFDEGNRRAS